MSKFAPTMMKKIGMKKPNPIASSFMPRRPWTDLRLSDENAAPARNAPRMISEPITSLKTTNPSISVIATRTGSSAVFGAVNASRFTNASSLLRRRLPTQRTPKNIRNRVPTTSTSSVSPACS